MRLPQDIQQMITRELDRSADDQRAGIAKLSGNLVAGLKAKGISAGAMSAQIKSWL